MGGGSPGGGGGRGGAGGNGTAGLNGTGGEGTAGGGGHDCVSYCDLMTSGCPDAYHDSTECLDLCAAYQWPVGTLASSGNTILCRTFYGMLAMTQPALHDRYCLAAGASSGSGVPENDGDCASVCRIYCEAASNICPELLNGQSVTTCARDCRGGPRAAMLPIYSGDTLDCRIYWIGRAAMDPSLCVEGSLTSRPGARCSP